MNEKRTPHDSGLFFTGYGAVTTVNTVVIGDSTARPLAPLCNSSPCGELLYNRGGFYYATYLLLKYVKI